MCGAILYDEDHVERARMQRGGINVFGNVRVMMRMLILAHISMSTIHVVPMVTHTMCMSLVSMMMLLVVTVTVGASDFDDVVFFCVGFTPLPPTLSEPLAARSPFGSVGASRARL